MHIDLLTPSLSTMERLWPRHHEMQTLNLLLPIEPKLRGHIATNCPCVQLGKSP